jgi:NAD(P)H-hydrate epimerase
MIAGLAAQGFSAWDAAVFGVYLHGRAGDLAAKEKGEYGMIASDLIEKIPYAISKNS